MAILDKVKEALEPLGAKVEEVRPGYITASISVENLKKAAQLLFNLGFDHVVSVEGVDWIKDNEIEVAYHAASYEPELHGVIVKLSTRVPRDKPELETLIDVWPSALYPERETWEMLGVVFKGHPELKRLLLPPDYQGPPPLRKDYKVPEEGFIVDLTRKQ